MGDRWAWVQQFKIQPNRKPTASMLLHCGGVTLYNHLFLVLPASGAQWAWRPPVDLPARAPSLLELIAGVIGNLCSLTFSISSGICSIKGSAGCIVSEAGSGHSGFWTTLLILCLQCHLLTTWAFMVLHVYVSIEDHCGYDFPWSTSRLIPFGIYGGPATRCAPPETRTNFARTSATGTKYLAHMLISVSLPL
ncbi:hypothetical protein INR49_010780 [Caranx melampygus]|nr:hypothetical protein INR49_010780 [Caranx melampygus]